MILWIVEGKYSGQANWLPVIEFGGPTMPPIIGGVRATRLAAREVAKQMQAKNRMMNIKKIVVRYRVRKYERAD
jgi:hypothetical protein